MEKVIYLYSEPMAKMDFLKSEIKKNTHIIF